MKNFKAIYSINFNEIPRPPKKIIYLIYHYTGMRSEKKAIKRLTDKNSKVSCHYFIKRNGEIINMVPDKFIAWHAGVSCWKNHKNLNNKSIGIEIQNSGHSGKYERFSAKQYKSLYFLTKILKRKYHIKSKNFLGHSDIAPDRKKDPGEKFPWKKLAKKRLCLWHNLNEKIIKKFRKQKISYDYKKIFINNLYKIGYKNHGNKSLTEAFQRRFRQDLINGKIDQECLLISKSLIKN